MEDSLNLSWPGIRVQMKILESKIGEISPFKDLPSFPPSWMDSYSRELNLVRISSATRISTDSKSLHEFLLIYSSRRVSFLNTLPLINTQLEQNPIHHSKFMEWWIVNAWICKTKENINQRSTSTSALMIDKTRNERISANLHFLDVLFL